MTTSHPLSLCLILGAALGTAPHAAERQLDAGVTGAQTAADSQQLLDRASALRKQGKYDEALPLAEQAVALRERLSGQDDLAIADALHLLAVIYDDKRDYPKAEAPNQRALAIREKALGSDHPDVARSLFNLAWLAKVKQNFAEAEALYRRALDIQERALGPDDPAVATTLNDMAVLFNQKGEFNRSIEINLRVLAMRERALGTGDPGVAKALNNLARAYELKGENALARAALERALVIWENALGPTHPDVANALDGLARVNHTAGDYISAEPLYLRALAIREQTFGPEDIEVATTLNNLALLYQDKGDYEKAEPLVLRDIAITEKKLGPAHASLAPSLTNLAGIYERRDQFDRAEPLYRRALAIQGTALGPKHAAVGVTLSRLGQLYVRWNTDAAQALTLLKRATEVLEAAVGPDHPSIPQALAGLAALAEQRGDAAEAQRDYERALEIQERTLGAAHPEVARSLERLASLHQRHGDVHRAIELLSRAHDTREQHLAHNLALGSERQKLGYLKLFADDTDAAVSLHAQRAPHDARALQLAFTALLSRKGRALDATSDNIGLLRVHATVEDRALFDRLSAARSQWSTLMLRRPSAATSAYQTQLARLRTEVDQLESEVGARSAPFRAQARPVTLDAVRAALPPGATLVEFAAYRPIAADGGQTAAPRYAVYTLGSGEAQWADLGDAATIDRAVETWRAALADPKRTDVTHFARALDAQVMQPVRALAGKSRHLLLSPDGPLNLIPFAALVDERNRYLVEDYTLTYLTSGRDLLRLQEPRTSQSPALIVAAPAFGEPALMAQGDGVDYSQVFFGPLPGVNAEVRALRDILPNAAVITGVRATEAALRGVKGPRILHIATHGFFLSHDGETRDLNPTSAASGPPTRIGKWAAWADNPLLRSGLALAGANQGRSGNDDGILTAFEAAGLDLWGTKLVVLSACDTGVGQVTRGDGVYGLRRTLVLAGSESQLMSLWPVSDRSTRDLMIDFYTNLTRSEGRSAALRLAQLRMLRDNRQSHPYYWASFIQSGEWANLDGRR